MDHNSLNRAKRRLGALEQQISLGRFARDTQGMGSERLTTQQLLRIESLEREANHLRESIKAYEGAEGAQLGASVDVQLAQLHRVEKILESLANEAAYLVGNQLAAFRAEEWIEPEEIESIDPEELEEISEIARGLRQAIDAYVAYYGSTTTISLRGSAMQQLQGALGRAQQLVMANETIAALSAELREAYLTPDEAQELIETDFTQEPSEFFVASVAPIAWRLQRIRDVLENAIQSGLKGPGEYSVHQLLLDHQRQLRKSLAYQLSRVQPWMQKAYHGGLLNQSTCPGYAWEHHLSELRDAEDLLSRLDGVTDPEDCINEMRGAHIDMLGWQGLKLLPADYVPRLLTRRSDPGAYLGVSQGNLIFLKTAMPTGWEIWSRDFFAQLGELKMQRLLAPLNEKLAPVRRRLEPDFFSCNREAWALVDVARGHLFAEVGAFDSLLLACGALFGSVGLVRQQLDRIVSEKTKSVELYLLAIATAPV